MSSLALVLELASGVVDLVTQLVGGVADVVADLLDAVLALVDGVVALIGPGVGPTLRSEGDGPGRSPDAGSTEPPTPWCCAA
ncbi:MAG TPA: hypothetical protein VK988_00730 [Acidimicrobiales bacterium]|nr:hypothetical protein [Acidimicrobiales bacterium]